MRNQSLPYDVFFEALRDNEVDALKAHPVLIVCGDAKCTDKMVAAVRKRGLEAICCSCVEDARSLLSRRRFSLVFSSDTLPDGEVRSVIGPAGTIPVVVFSQRTDWGKGSPFNQAQDSEEFANMSGRRLKTKVLVDGGDPQETLRVRSLVGYVDGQTTNPSLIAKNPEVRKVVSSGQKFSSQEELDEYKKIVQTISPLVGDAGVSIEVFADLDTPAEQMFAQGQEMFSWVPNAYVKYPCTHEGLRAAQMSVARGIRVNITLCFSQDQAAAVYAATKGSKEPVYVSPFLGRLDDRGDNGMDLVRNIKRMYQAGDGHVHVLAASIRHLKHVLGSFASEAELVTAPCKVWEEWAAASFPVPEKGFVYTGTDKTGHDLKPIPYKEFDLRQPWESFDIRHELTAKGIQQFVADYQRTLRQSA